MIFRATDWMSSRWWAALAIAMAFILVARTGTVGAPAAEERVDDRPMTRRFAQRDLDRGALVTYTRAKRTLENHVRDLEDQLVTLQTELELERERAEILASGYQDLEAKFDRVTSSVRGLVEADATIDGDLAPAPIQAIFVHGLEESAVTPLESDR